MAGNTTLLTTVLIWDEAVVQVPSIAPATSPVPAAKTVVANIIARSMLTASITIHFLFLIVCFLLFLSANFYLLSLKIHSECFLQEISCRLKSNFLRWILRSDVPVHPQIPPDTDAVRQVHGQHPGRGPAVDEPGVGGIAPVRVPDRCEMGPPLIGAVLVFLKLKPCLVPAPGPPKETPEAPVLEFREIRHRVLGRSSGRTLTGTDPSRHGLLDPIPGFQRASGSGGILPVRRDPHGGRQARMVGVQIKLPPAVAIGNPHLLPDCV